MSINVTGAYVYFEIPILGGIPITQTAVSSFIVAVLLCIAFIKLGKNLEKRPGKMQVLVEKGVMVITNLTASAMGKHNVHWTPFMGCLFLCSICGSYIGLTGFLRSSTADINCTATNYKLVVNDVFHNVSHFLLTESDACISQSYILAIILVGIIEIALTFNIPTLAFTEKKCISKFSYVVYSDPIVGLCFTYFKAWYFNLDCFN
ncbi:MAG: F0F1 ATP synthase subunit A, partial [Clostridia bacterium]|nr:F0F1 ATP synthase subunit A [Clostridia bacterium]